MEERKVRYYAFVKGYADYKGHGDIDASAAYKIWCEGQEMEDGAKFLKGYTSHQAEFLAILSALCKLPDGEDVIVWTNNRALTGTALKYRNEWNRRSALGKKFGEQYDRLGHVSIKWIAKNPDDVMQNSVMDLATQAMEEVVGMNHNCYQYR